MKELKISFKLYRLLLTNMKRNNDLSGTHLLCSGYKTELEKSKKEKEEREQIRQAQQLEKVRADLEKANIALETIGTLNRVSSL